MTHPQSDLGVRVASAIVMLAVAGSALWIGGWVFMLLVGAVGLGVLWEWWGLARRIASSWWARALWLVGGVGYVGLACGTLALMRYLSLSALPVVLFIGSVVAVDVGAYFAGRAIGGPKIAPSISPSKTWAGLIGGAFAASLTISLAVFISTHYFTVGTSADFSPVKFGLMSLGCGALIAIIAQSGDFFESWMKRRAGVKDSGSLIPGHGGLFDRVDGMLLVLFVGGVLWLAVG